MDKETGPTLEEQTAEAGSPPENGNVLDDYIKATLAIKKELNKYFIRSVESELKATVWQIKEQLQGATVSALDDIRRDLAKAESLLGQLSVREEKSGRQLGGLSEQIRASSTKAAEHRDAMRDSLQSIRDSMAKLPKVQDDYFKRRLMPIIDDRLAHVAAKSDQLKLGEDMDAVREALQEHYEVLSGLADRKGQDLAISAIDRLMSRVKELQARSEELQTQYRRLLYGLGLVALLEAAAIVLTAI